MSVGVWQLSEPSDIGGEIWYAEDPSRPGCWATGATADAALAELAEVVEEWEQVVRTFA